MKKTPFKVENFRLGHFRIWGLLETALTLVAFPMSSQCYKTFTGLYLQVFKYRPILNIICSHYYCLTPFVYACFYC